MQTNIETIYQQNIKPQKLSVANKEAFETKFWLRLLRDSNFLSEKQSQSLLDDCEELQKMLISSLRTTKKSE